MDIDRPGVVLFVALLCLPSLAVAIPDGGTTGTPLDETNTTSAETTTIDTAVATTDAVVTTARNSVSGTNTETTTTTATDSSDDVRDETRDTISDATTTVDDSAEDESDGTGESVTDTVDTRDSVGDTVDSATGSVGDTTTATGVDAPDTDAQTAAAVGETAGQSSPAGEMTESNDVAESGDSLADGTATATTANGGGDQSAMGDTATEVTSAVDTATERVASTENAATTAKTGNQASENGVSASNAKTSDYESTTVDQRETDATGGGNEASATSADETTEAGGALASADETETNTRQRRPSSKPVPKPVETAGLAGAVLVLGVGSHLPDVTALTINSGATAVAPVATGRENHRLWRVLTMFRYSRYDDSDPLEHEVRCALFERIERTPGLYLSELDARMDVSLSTIRHHLRVLEREEMITGTKVRGKRRFYPDDDGVELAAALADGPTAAVLDAVARREPASGGELADELNRDPSTVTHHLKRLEADGLVERERDGRTIVNRLSPEAQAAFSNRPAASADD
ncbi:helix-turn-helix domain-containing protein [Haladaptatus sp. DFWS20]|uniref:winged helix-turn-helix transcriptional regulator n=1 Tax=Haladaptatus sp. DFWS20 TaxID=3403467 RepID=UPI003EBCA201